MTYRFTLIPGDGIGPEITRAVLEILLACGLRIDWDVQQAGMAALEEHDVPLPAAVIASIRRNRVALKGPVTTPVGRGYTSVNVALRKSLGLYAALRPVRSFSGVRSPWQDVDLEVVRENTEGLYAGFEDVVAPGVTVAVRLLSRQATRTIARFAYAHAVKEGRRKVTVAHKADIVKLGDGLFLQHVREIAEEYPSIATETLTVDNLAMQLALDPQAFDVLLLENLFGDIVSDMAAGLVGGLGLVPGANLGDEIAVFEAVHGSAPDIAGLGKANPIALTLSAAMLLHHVGEHRQADRLRTAVERVLAEGRVRTVDLGGQAETDEMAQAIIEALPR